LGLCVSALPEALWLLASDKREEARVIPGGSFVYVFRLKIWPGGYSAPATTAREASVALVACCSRFKSLSICCWETWEGFLGFNSCSRRAKSKPWTSSGGPTRRNALSRQIPIWVVVPSAWLCRNGLPVASNCGSVSAWNFCQFGNGSASIFSCFMAESD